MRAEIKKIAREINCFKAKVIVASTAIFLGASYLIYSNESNEEKAERLRSATARLVE